MTILATTGTLDFDIYAFDFAALLQEFAVAIYNSSTATLKFSYGLEPESYISFVGVTAEPDQNQPWDGTITSLTYSRAGSGLLTLTEFALNAEIFRSLALTDSRGFFTQIFQGDDSFSFADGQGKIESGVGSDNIIGGTNDDFIVAGAGTDVINGNEGFDTLDHSNHAGASTGIVVTVTGNGSGTVLDPNGDLDSYLNIERITGTAFADTFNSGNTAVENNEWVGGNGADVFNGGAGFDAINFDAEKYTISQFLTSGIIVNFATGIAVDSFGFSDTFSNIEAITATDFADNVTGSATASISNLRAGDDIYTGGTGDEWINPGAGDDTINGGLGYDTISYANTDTALQNFDPLSNFVIGGVVVNGGVSLGSATIFDPYGGMDFVAQIEHISGSKLDDVFVAGNANLTFTGNQGRDTYSASATSRAIIDYSGEFDQGGLTGVSINLTTAKIVDSFGNLDRVFGFSHFRGTRFGDSFIGIAGRDTIFFAGDGDDTVAFSNGNDWVAPGRGQNHLDGGTGYDQINYTDLTANFGEGIHVALHSMQQGEVTKVNNQIDDFAGFELIFGTTGADVFHSNDYGGDFSGGQSTDIFFGGTNLLLLDTVDYAAEQNYLGWRNGVVVNLSNATFQFTPTRSLVANAAIDSYGDIDRLYNIDVIRGTGLNDIFVAGLKSTFEGGKGNDVYWFDGGDNAIEKAGQGTDVIYTRSGMSLPSHVENLVLVGSAQWGLGNASNNVITGNTGNNLLGGSLGLDTLTGKSGRDTFRFDAKPASTSRDTITDFSATYDQFSLDRSYFTKLGVVGKLSANAFHLGSAAHDTTDRIIYNRSTGAVYYDADGTGATAKIHFATLSNKVALTYLDFDVIA